MAIVEGKKPPAFSLRDAAGKSVALDDFKGKDVVVYFYPKDDTPGCTKEACGFRDNIRDFAKADAAVIGISRDRTRMSRVMSAKPCGVGKSTTLRMSAIADWKSIADCSGAASARLSA